MVTLAREQREILASFRDVEELEDVARSLPPEEAGRVVRVARGLLERVPPVRVPIAGELLHLSEKTVRTWTDEGVLVESVTDSSRRLLEPQRLHAVLHLVRDLRAHGRHHGLLDEVWRRLQDQALLDRADLRESLAQLHSGDTVEA